MFCTVCNVCCELISDHMVKAYNSIGGFTVLYVESNVSLCLPNLEEERTLSKGIVLYDLVDMLSMCLL